MVVGEAPGRFEDEQGRPFVGRAGQLLDELLAEAGLARGEVFITNVVKARPPGNRDPTRAEVEHWMPVLEQQLALVAPRLVVPLGRHALAHFAPGGEDRRGARARDQRARARRCSRSTTRRRRCARRSCARRCSPTRASCGRCSRADRADLARPRLRAGPRRLTGAHGAARGPTGGRRAAAERAARPARPAVALGGRRRRAARAGRRLGGHAARDHRDRRHRAAGAVRQAHDGRRHPGDHRAAAGDAARPARRAGCARARCRRRSPPRSPSALALRRLPRPVGARDPAVRQPGARRGRQRPAGRRAGRATPPRRSGSATARTSRTRSSRRASSSRAGRSPARC